MSDPVHNPAHYQGPQCPHCRRSFEIRYLIEGMPFFRGAAMKYIFRAGRKPGAPEEEDLRKACQCVEFELERIQRGEQPGDSEDIADKNDDE